MFSEMFLKLWDNGLIQKGIWETIYMTVLSSAISYVIGLPLGVILNITDKDGINPIHWLNRILGLVVNFFRSIPFIILMVAMLPVAKLICASNENRVLYDFFRTGVYDRRRDFVLTSSPSMDILISSNLERLIYQIAGRDPEACR